MDLDAFLDIFRQILSFHLVHMFNGCYVEEVHRQRFWWRIHWGYFSTDSVCLNKCNESNFMRRTLLLLLTVSSRLIDHLLFSAFSKAFISNLLCQVWISEPSINLLGDTFLFFLPLLYIFFLIFAPTLGTSTSPSPCGRPLLPREGVKLKLARRCGPFSRLLCIASAWFPSSSCWLCRLRSVPTRTGKTHYLLGY